jgi:hypothetical protein
MRARTILGAVPLALVAITPAAAGTYQNALAALARQDYVAAARLLWPLAQAGDPRAPGDPGIHVRQWSRRAAELHRGRDLVSLRERAGGSRCAVHARSRV